MRPKPPRPSSWRPRAQPSGPPKLLQLEQLAEELAARSEELRERTRRTAHFGKGRMLRAYPRLRHGTKQLTLDELRERLKYEHKHSA